MPQLKLKEKDDTPLLPSWSVVDPSDSVFSKGEAEAAASDDEQKTTTSKGEEDEDEEEEEEDEDGNEEGSEEEWKTQEKVAFRQPEPESGIFVLHYCAI